MSVVSSNILAGASGQSTDTSYQIKKGLRFNSDDSAYMSRIPGTEGNRRTWTWSAWVKRSKIAGDNQPFLTANSSTGNSFFMGWHGYYSDGREDALEINNVAGVGDGYITSGVYRDTSAWYHVVVAFDSTQSTAGDRIQCFINGVQQTWQQTVNGPNQNDEWKVNDTIAHTIGDTANSFTGQGKLDSYLADVQFIDGSALLPTVFGEYDSNGVWQPKKVTEADLITAKESQQPYNTRHNMAQEWSNGTETGWYIGVEKVFNHNYGDAGVPNTNANAEFTFGTAFTSTKIEALVAYGNNSGVEYGVMVDGTWHNVYASQIPNSSQQWVTLYEGSEGSVTKIRAQCGASGGGSLVAIKSNNRELVDGPADNTRIWSNNVSPLSQIYIGTPEMAFNGSLSTSAGGGFAFQANQEITLLTGESISASTLKVHANVSSSATFRVNGSTVTDDADGSSKWITLSGWSSPITSLSIEDAYQSTCRGVEIDGKILVDSPSQWNCSETWSGGLSTSNIQAGTTKYLFNGNISANGWADHTYAYAATQGTAASITGITTPTGSIRIRGYKNNAGSQFTINGGNTYSFSATNTTEWISITETSITSITFNTTGTTYLSGIEVGGKLLVDGGWGTNGFHLPFDDATDIGKDTAATAPALDPRGGFDAVTYTGSGTYNQISDLRFAPDLVWIKDRSAGNHHYLVDSVRGVGTSEALFPDRDVAAGDGTQRVSSLNSDGFSVFGTYGYTNTSGSNYVAWCWKAGGAAVSNSDGTITSTVSADQNYGFSVVKYTGNSTSTATVGHGLNAAPSLVLIKDISSTRTWGVSHVSGGQKLMKLDTNIGWWNSSTTYWYDLPTSSVFYPDNLVNDHWFNISGNTYMAYCWSEVAGYSKFSSYSGNGSTAGTIVTTGFKPAFVLIKGTSNSRDWWIYDIARDPTNPNMARLSPNSSGAEATNVYAIDFLDNGFQLKTSDVALNGSGETYIYAAFADYPANNFTPHNLITEENTSAKNNFGAFTWTGNSTAGTVIDTGFQPDLVWVKGRGAADYAGLFDSVRGATKYVIPSTNTAEGTDANAISSFTSSGFTLGTGYTSIATNNNAATYAGWAWKAGGTASSNTNGTITSSVSANPNFGFSIVTYTGSGSNATIGHGLSSPPKMIFVRRRDSTGGTYVYHASPGPTRTGYLYGTSLFETYAAAYNDTAPTSSVFSVGTAAATNASGGTYVAYCWSEVPGYSRFSSYVGNGSSTGPVIDCGFKPAFLLIKAQIAGEDWTMHDSNRGSQNIFFANTNDAELSSSAYDVEFTDTGFQIKNTNPRFNTSGSTYYYAAFAEPTYGDLDLVNDTPTANAADPVKGNYATLNPIDKGSNSALSNGNLYVVKSGTTWASCGVRGTIGVTSGKYYWEITKNNSAQYSMFGVAEDSASFSDTYAAPVNAIWGYISNSGNKFNGSDGGSGASYGASFTTGDVIGVALDMDTGTLVFYNNGVSQGTAYTNLSGKTIFPWVHLYTDTDSAICNFGQQPFKYTPPSGYKELCTTNLPDPTITDGSKHFDAKLWTGDGNATRDISSYEFNPGFVWIKERPANGWQHTLYDVIRGPGTSSVTKSLSTNSTRTEASGNDTNHGFLSGFISNGFQLTKGSQASGDYVNHSGWGYVGWAWDAGSSNTSIAAGSLNSSAYDQSATWSSLGTASNWQSSYPFTNIFNGNDYGSFGEAAAGNSASWTYTINNITSFKIRVYVPNRTYHTAVNDVKVNGSDIVQAHVITPNLAEGWHTLDLGNIGSFTSLEVDDSYWYVQAIYINGKQLVDKSQALGKTVTRLRFKTDWDWMYVSQIKINGSALTTGTLDNSGSVWSDPDKWKNGSTGSGNETYSQSARGDWFDVTLASNIANFSELEIFVYLDASAGSTTNIFEIELFFSDGTSYTRTYASNSDAPTPTSNGFNNRQWQNFGDLGPTVLNLPSIASTVRANPSAGFSVVTYSGNSTSGATVGHGLNAAPEFIVVKARDTAQHWATYHVSTGATHYLLMESTNAAVSYAGFMNHTAPTSTVFSLGTDNMVNTGYDYVAYCFAPVEGYSKVGSYTGNASTDGPFVYTGFRPAFLLIKNSSLAGSNWIIVDTARDTYNESDNLLKPNSADAEQITTANEIDILSNGFKARGTDGDTNGNGNTLIYVAFAENPFKSSRAR